MLKNNMKVGLRDLRRHPGYATANIAGLAIGIACCLLVLLYAVDAHRYDLFHEGVDQLYRVHEIMDDTGEEWASAPWAVAEVLRQERAGALEVARLRRRGPGVEGEVTVRQGDRVFVERNLFYADSTIFKVLTFPLLVGDPERALSRPRDVVLTADMAAKYFGEENPVGRTLLLADVPHTVTGILENVPEHSHLQFGFLASMESTWNPSPGDGSPWRFDIYYTYAKVPNEAMIPELKRRLKARQRQQTSHASTFKFFPVKDIHLHSDAERELTANGDVRAVYILAIIGAFLLAIACINFINLTTARSAERAREVGVRKVLGADRRQLVRQFLAEAGLLTLLGMLVAFVLAWSALPFFRRLVETNLTFDLSRPWWLPLALLGLVVLVGLMAGSYPAFYLSGLQPVRVLKGRLLGSSRPLLRQALVVTQFSLSILLVIGTLVVSRQIDFMQSAHLGLEKDQVLVLSATNTRKLQGHYGVLKQELEKERGVQSIATSDVVPGERLAVSYFAPAEAPADDSLIALRRLLVDEDFAPTYALEFVMGRNFPERADSPETTAHILNEAAVRALGWTDPLGKQIDGSEVIGVVKDFHYASLHRDVEPMIMTNRGGYAAISIRLDTRDVPGMLGRLEKVWHSVIPNEPFEFFFLEDQFDRLYHREATLRRAVGYGTVLAIFLACLGLFGLASFTTQQRRKEIGIRKILGSTVVGIVALLSRDFLKPVGIAFLIAAPVGYVVFRKWLQEFVYRIEIGADIFIIAGALAASLALATVAYQSVRAASSDPVKSLQAE